MLHVFSARLDACLSRQAQEMQENNVSETSAMWNYTLLDASDTEVDGAHDEPGDEAAEPV